MVFCLNDKQIEFLNLVLFSYNNKGNRTLASNLNDNKMKKSILKALKNEVVYIRTVSRFQKDDCLFCSEPSAAEAIYKSAQIRCCVKHIPNAKKTAKRLGA